MKTFLRILFPFKFMYMMADPNSGGAGSDMVEMKDPITLESVMVPKALEAFIGKIASYNRREGAKRKQDEIDALQTTIDNLTVDLEFAKKGRGKESEVIEKLKDTHATQLKELSGKIEQLIKENDKYKSMFEDERIRNDIMAALPLDQLFNPDDTLEKIRKKGNARLQQREDAVTGEKKDIFDTVLTITVIDENKNSKQIVLPPKEAVQKFLAMDENKYHLKNKLYPGGSSQAGNFYAGGSKELTSDQFNSMNAQERVSFIESGGVVK